MNTLLLDSSYRPIEVITWQRAVCLLVQNKAEVIEDGASEVRSPSRSFKVPKILRLIRAHFFKKEASFSKRNLFLRDKCSCAYCGRKFPFTKLTVDHIVPRCQGGSHSFKNTVAACFECNNKKGGRTPAQASMQLLVRPTTPSAFEIMVAAMADSEVYKSWISAK